MQTTQQQIAQHPWQAKYETFLRHLDEIEASQQFEGQYEACNIRKYDIDKDERKFLAALFNLKAEIRKRKVT